MQYFTETAYTHREALAKISAKYGELAKILTHRSVRLGGVFGLFTREGIELTGYLSQETRKNRRLDPEEEKKKILSTVKNDQTLQLVLKEVQQIKLKMATDRQPEVEQHATIDRIEELMIRNDFSVRLIRETVSRIRREFSLDELDDYDLMQDRVVEWIGDGIRLYDVFLDQMPRAQLRAQLRSQPIIIILVGPTGVGKTTTIAKLAAVHGIGGNGTTSKSVRMITIDNYRIGARQQIETYGEIMGIPVSYVETFQDLRKKIALCEDVDLVLIDTIGKSPKDYMKLAEMRELLDACGSEASVFLVVSATTKITVLMEVLHQFEPFKYEALVLTKLDETMRIGNIVSALYEKDIPIAYLTDGQIVPQDIAKATVTELLMHLDGFRVDQEKITGMFDRPGATKALL